MRKETRDALIIIGVESAIVGVAALTGRVIAKPPVPLVGEAILQGTIICAETDKPIPFANVTILGVTCTADENGFYRIDEIPLGTHSVRFSAPGFTSKTLQLTFPEEDIYTKNIGLTASEIVPLALVEEV